MELQNKLIELENQRIQNIQDFYDSETGYYAGVQKFYEASQGVLDARGDSIASDKYIRFINEQIKAQQQQSAILAVEEYKLGDELKKAAAVFGTSSQEYKKAYTAWWDVKTAFQESKIAAYELRDALFENARTLKEQVVDKWSRVLDRIDAARNYYSARPDSIKTQDANIIQTYIDENSKTQEKINALNASISTYRNQMQYFDATSQKYQDLADKVNSAEVEIMNLGTGIYKNLSEVFDIYTNRFDQRVEKLSTAIDEANSIVDLLGEESFVDKSGNITANGQAGIMLYGTMINKNTDAMEDWRHAIEEVNNAYSSGRISEEKRNELVSEYTKNIQDAVAKNKEYANSLTEIYKKQLENENELLQTNINRRKEALQSKEDYYNYDRTLRDSNKDIQSLEAQIAALEGSTSSASGQARLLQLQEQLRQAQEARDDTLRSHRNELIQSGYDSLSQNAQTALDDTLSALENNSTFQQQIVSNMLDNIVANYATAYGTIANIIEGTGDVISNTLQSALSITASNASEASRVANRAKQTVDTNDGLGTGGYNHNHIENSTGNQSMTNAMSAANLSGNALNTTNALAKDSANSANEGIGGAAIKRTYATASASNVTVQQGSSKTISVKDGKILAVHDAEHVSFKISGQNITFTGTKVGNEAVVIATDNGSITISVKVTAKPQPATKATSSTKSTSTSSSGASYYNSTYFGNGSIVDALMRSAGYSYEQVKDWRGLRSQIAALNGISNYKGTAAQNTQLLNLLVAGKLKRPDGGSSSSSSSSGNTYFPATATKNGSIVDTLAKAGYDSSYAYRKKIAAANGISGYKGTAAQNIQMLELLKAGKLIKPKKKGGLIDQIIPLANLRGGDDGLITAQLGEAVLPKPFMKDVVPDFMKTVQQTTKLLSPVGNGGDISVHYDSLLTVNGNVDKDALPGLRDLLQQSYEYTSQKMYKDLKKIGYK